jgi:hypothetical protein
MSGTVSGGWEFVIAAYAVTITFVGLYAAGVIHRYRSAVRRADGQGRAPRRAQ